MKRWFSLVLILALICTAMPGMALADAVEPSAGDAAAGQAGEGLFIEGAAPVQEPDETEASPAGEVEETFTARYARATAESTDVFAEASAETAFAAIPAGSRCRLSSRI